MALTAWELAQPKLDPKPAFPVLKGSRKAQRRVLVMQVPGPAVSFARGMLRRARRAEREASR